MVVGLLFFIFKFSIGIQTDRQTNTIRQSGKNPKEKERKAVMHVLGNNIAHAHYQKTDDSG